MIAQRTSTSLSALLILSVVLYVGCASQPQSRNQRLATPQQRADEDLKFGRSYYVLYK